MGMADILLNGADPFEQIINILSTERRPYVNHVKSSENCFKEEDIKRFYNFVHVNSPRTKGPRSPPLQNVDSSYCFITLIKHCNFQQLVFIIHWENDFSTFSSYKCMGYKFGLAVKRSKVNLQTLFEKLSRPWVIWTNIVDLEFLMLFTKMQLQSFLVLEKKILSFFLAYLGMAVILFSGTEPFKHCQYRFDRKPYVKSGDNCSSSFREDI